jgi:hypothetical protein
VSAQPPDLCPPLGRPAQPRTVAGKGHGEQAGARPAVPPQALGGRQYRPGVDVVRRRDPVGEHPRQCAGADRPVVEQTADVEQFLRQPGSSRVSVAGEHAGSSRAASGSPKRSHTGSISPSTRSGRSRRSSSRYTRRRSCQDASAIRAATSAGVAMPWRSQAATAIRPMRGSGSRSAAVIVGRCAATTAMNTAISRPNRSRWCRSPSSSVSASVPDMARARSASSRILRWYASGSSSASSSTVTGSDMVDIMLAAAGTGHSI